uniref:Uncharacterized protein n=1 Tax=Anguilla anguilla TaxID=7936 RepID=A0A0E9U0B5_ANGAN
MFYLGGVESVAPPHPVAFGLMVGEGLGSLVPKWRDCLSPDSSVHCVCLCVCVCVCVCTRVRVYMNVACRL